MVIILSFDSENLISHVPAKEFTDAYALGNGRLGVLDYGGAECRRLSLNLDELWAGYPRDSVVKNSVVYYREARRLSREGKLDEAQKLLEKKFQSFDVFPYLPLGTLYIETDVKRASGLERILSLSDAVSSVTYEKGGVKYKTECFVSAPSNCVVYRMSAENGTIPPVKIRFESPLRFSAETVKDGYVKISGECPGDVIDDEPVYFEESDKRGIAFVATFACDVPGAVCDGASISVPACEEFTLLFGAVSDFGGWDSPRRTLTEDDDAVKLALSKSYDVLLDEHVKDHRQYYDRVKLDLDTSDGGLDTQTRLEKHAEGAEDPALYELLFNFGRYLMISGSRPGSQCMNLQGIWNEKVMPPWRSDYTVNINTEMNYWPALSVGLPEMYEPYLSLIEDISQSGKAVAREYYGARGYCCHHNTDIFRTATPVQGSAVWSFWPMSGGWFADDHYKYSRYTGKREDKIKSLDILRSCCEFYLDVLEDDGTGELIFEPSTSPENDYSHRSSHDDLAVSRTTAMTQDIIRAVFFDYISLCEDLGIDDIHYKEVRSTLNCIRKYKVDSQGRIIEWYEEEIESEPHHRHMSPVWGLYPGELYSLDGTPAAAEACRKLIESRGDAGTGWSLGWKICLRAKLREGDKCLKLIDMQLSPSSSKSIRYRSKGGTYSNMFDAHPPFQIDGNFGSCAGIASMFLQSDRDNIYLLPALPKAWSNGSVSGLCTIYGVRVDIKWKDGKVTDYTVYDDEKKYNVIDCTSLSNNGV